MILAIASGKGGTGKTTVAVNMARVLDDAVLLLDCDVEEPNAHLFLKGCVEAEETVSIPVPQVDESLCDGCSFSPRCATVAAAAPWSARRRQSGKRIGASEWSKRSGLKTSP